MCRQRAARPIWEVSLHAKISDRIQPGVVYTTFPHPDSGVNLVTTDCDREEGISLRRVAEAQLHAAE